MNIKSKIVGGLVLALLMAGGSGSAKAYVPPNSGTVPLNPAIRQLASTPPLGLQLFCLQNPRSCETKSRVGRTAYSGKLMNTLRQINSKVNRLMIPRNDGRIDNWTVNARVGDCEDFAMNKRALLIKAGVPAGALRIATGVTRRGEGHAVLVVRTSQGDLVLDNRTMAIKLLNKTDLRQIEMSGKNLAFGWTKAG